MIAIVTCNCVTQTLLTIFKLNSFRAISLSCCLAILLPSFANVMSKTCCSSAGSAMRRPPYQSIRSVFKGSRRRRCSPGLDTAVLNWLLLLLLLPD